MSRHILALTNPTHRQLPFAEYLPDLGIWCVWQHYNTDSTAGTQLLLYPTGLVSAVSIGPDGLPISSRFIMKEYKS